MKALFATVALTVFLAAGAIAQEALPAVDTMNCEQMQAELMVAGQQMNAQMDPEFAREAQAMHQQNQQASQARPNVAAGIGTAAACSIPGVGMACMAGQAAQAQQAQRQTAENHARMAAQTERLQQSMAGLDQNRLMQLSERFEQQGCQVPQ